MPALNTTKTLFQTLQFDGGMTFTIEVIQQGNEDTHDLGALPPELARQQLQQDPWGDKPITYQPNGTAIYAPTRVVPRYVGREGNRAWQQCR